MDISKRIFGKPRRPMFPMLAYHLRKHRIPSIIGKEARRKKQVVYGSHAMNVQLPFALRRRASDFDIYTRSPRASAQAMQKRLDREVAGQDDFFAKRAKHKGTWKVMHEGEDQKQRTKDDIAIVDYSKQPRNLQTVRRGRLAYENLRRIERGKRKSLRIPANKYRHRKDRADLERIECFRALKNMLDPKWWEKR